MYRQGDILIIPASEAEIVDAEANGQRVKRDNGQLVLAYGESSGHSHAVRESQVQMYATVAGQYLRAAVPFAVVHEEHSALTLPAGAFRVIRQRECSPTATSRVSD